MLESPIDRVAVTIAYEDQARVLLDLLAAQGFTVTVVDARGGFLQEAMVTLVTGMPRQRVPYYLALVRETCPERTRFISVGMEFPSPADAQIVEVRTGGATVFVVPVDEFLQL